MFDFAIEKYLSRWYFPLNTKILTQKELVYELDLVYCRDRFDPCRIYNPRFCDMLFRWSRSDYPGWEYKAVSPLRDAYVEAYRGLFGDMPTVGVIHAGLECGIISDKLCGDIDIISVGPNLSDIHSPSERADIASCQRIYDILLSMLCKYAL